MRSTLLNNAAFGLRLMDALKIPASSMTLAGTYTMAANDRMVHLLDPGGAGRTVLLPPEAEGIYLIWNKADAAEDLTVKEDSNTTTILTISQNEAGILFCDGTSWHRALLSAAAT